MKQFTSLQDVDNLNQMVKRALWLKGHPYRFETLGKHKTLITLFFNPSLRTRLSTEKAAYNLGMSVINLDASHGWKLEFQDEVVMVDDSAEHIREAAAVISQYADIIGIRTFASLSDKERDYQDEVLNKFIRFVTVPVISLESAIRHPLQSLADLMTITEHKKVDKPKVVLSWAPHPRALPQAVPNSFLEWMAAAEVDLTVTHPQGYELAPEFAGDIKVVYDQQEALEGADFVYAKNWSAYKAYGQVLSSEQDWMITAKKMQGTNNGKFMHCLPVRRNVVVEDAVLDGPHSIVIEQARNREFAAQAVLMCLLEKCLNIKL